jgi:hypothetical protein
LNEISISGFCEKCFDEITKVDEDIEWGFYGDQRQKDIKAIGKVSI